MLLFAEADVTPSLVHTRLRRYSYMQEISNDTIVVILAELNYAMFVTLAVLMSAGRDTQSVKVVSLVAAIFRM